MKTLSKLIREAADHGFWFSEVERIAVLLGCESRDDVDIAWQAVSEIVDSIAVLAFDYRHQSDEFVPILKEWYADQQIRLRIRSDIKKGLQDSHLEELPSDRIVMAILWRLLCRIESAYEQFELGLQSKHVLSQLDPPKLRLEQKHLAKEVAAHLHKAVSKVKELQESMDPSSFEFDVYQNILEAAIHHFEEMSIPTKEETKEVA